MNKNVSKWEICITRNVSPVLQRILLYSWRKALGYPEKPIGKPLRAWDTRSRSREWKSHALRQNWDTEKPACKNSPRASNCPYSPRGQPGRGLHNGSYIMRWQVRAQVPFQTTFVNLSVIAVRLQIIAVCFTRGLIDEFRGKALHKAMKSLISTLTEKSVYF